MLPALWVNPWMIEVTGDWRLPALEEAMSLMEGNRNSEGLYIDSIFVSRQEWIWTSDLYSASAAWSVDFDFGYCDSSGMEVSSSYVRAVRSGH